MPFCIHKMKQAEKEGWKVEETSVGSGYYVIRRLRDDDSTFHSDKKAEDHVCREASSGSFYHFHKLLEISELNERNYADSPNDINAHTFRVLTSYREEVPFETTVVAVRVDYDASVGPYESAAVAFSVGSNQILRELHYKNLVGIDYEPFESSLLRCSAVMDFVDPVQLNHHRRNLHEIIGHLNAEMKTNDRLRNLRIDTLEGLSSMLDAWYDSTQASDSHLVIVSVEGCTRKQAMEVVRERIGHDEDYGFAYRISVHDPASTYVGYARRTKTASTAPIDI